MISDTCTRITSFLASLPWGKFPELYSRFSLVIYFIMLVLSHSFPALFNPLDCSSPGSSVHGNFSGQEYWSGLLFSPAGDLPDPGTEPTFPVSPASQADSSLLSHRGSPYLFYVCYVLKSLQSYLTLCNPVDYRPPGSSVHSGQEYWSGLPWHPPGNLPNPGIEPGVSCISCIGRWVLYH